MSQKFIKFINHLLSFDNQHNILLEKNPQYKEMPFRFNIDPKVLMALSLKAGELFKTEKNVLDISAPINVFGDIHGQFNDLIRFLKMSGLPTKNKILFMGDYVDRGNNSIEVVALLFSLKIIYPKSIYILRGNHECSIINKSYGFYDECIERFGNIDGENLFNTINKTLETLPLAATINNKIFCVHGGISPNLKYINDINSIDRFTSIPDEGLLCDLVWADPKSSNTEWEDSERGVSFTYNENALDKFMKTNNIDLVCRAHQMVANGYKFFNNNKLVTIFSAPNYCGECANDGAVMKINSNLECSFLIIKPINTKN